MSGSYTQTPNLGLYKPTPNSDTGTWGYHLNSNADLLDNLLGTSGGSTALFLPLSGGQMGGAIGLAADPVAGPAGAMQAVTRQYVDNNTMSQPASDARYLQLAAGGTVAGATTFGAGLTVSAGTLTAGALTTTGTSQVQIGNATSVNNIFRINPTVAGTTPNIVMVGKDTDVGLTFVPQGAGVFTAPRIAAGANFTFSGAFTAAQSPLSISANLSGASTDNYRNLSQLNINSDNVAGKAVQAFAINHNYGGAAMTGPRIAFAVGLNQTAATQQPTNTFYQGVQFTASAAFQEPGSTGPTATGAKGILFSGASTAQLFSGAINYNGLAGWEFDIVAGAQPWGVLGVSAVRLTGGLGTNYQAAEPSLDTGFRVGSAVANSAAWINGYTVTSPASNFAIDAVKGTAFKVFPGKDYATVKPAAAVGVDLSYVAFSQAAWHSQGAIIDGSGNASLASVSVGNWKTSLSASGLTIDPGGNQVCLTAAVSNGASQYSLNEQFSFAGNGRGIVTAVSGSTVTGIAILEFPTAATGSLPANPVATTSLMFNGAGQLTGSGLTLTLTWSPATTLALQPSGGATTFGGPLNYTATGGTVARAAQDRAADWINVKDYGAVGNGTADDTAAVTAALATHRPIFAPVGTYKTTLVQNAITGAIWGGPGQIIDSQGNKRGPILNEVNAAPTAGAWSNLLTAFNGDLSRVLFAIEHRIQGSSTLGLPTTGYLFTPETAAFAEYFYNQTGNNNSTSSASGRTGAVMHYMQAFQAGQGDIIPYYVSTTVTGAKAGATSFLANPAGTTLGANVNAGTAGVYLQGIGDISISDGGFDVAAAGLTINFTRNINTGALGVTWMGQRFQSLGSQPLDAFWTCRGPSTIGLDLVSMSTGNAVITMGTGQRIYGNATNVDPTHFPRYTALGAEWLGYTAGSGWQMAVGGAAQLSVTGTGMGFNGTAPVAKPTISGACAGNTAIKALLTALANYGLVTDSTTA